MYYYNQAIKITAANNEKAENGGDPKVCCVVLKVSTEYDNPILNHPDLLIRLKNDHGVSAVERAVDFSAQFVDTIESRNLLEIVFSNPSYYSFITEVIGVVGQLDPVGD